MTPSGDTVWWESSVSPAAWRVFFVPADLIRRSDVDVSLDRAWRGPRLDGTLCDRCLCRALARHGFSLEYAADQYPRLVFDRRFRRKLCVALGYEPLDARLSYR